MTKFVDETTSRERRDLYFMRDLLKEKERLHDERERRPSEMVMKREKEIRNDMKQLAATEARVAALQQQLQDQSMLPPNLRNEFGPRGRPYSMDYLPRSKPVSWFSPPEIGNEYGTLIPVGAMGTGLPEKSFTPAFTSKIGSSTYNPVELFVCSTVSTDTTTVSVLQARPSIATSDGSQPSFVSGYPVVLQSTVTTDASLTVNTSTINWPGLVQSQGSTAPVCQINPSVPGLTVPLSTLSLTSVSQGMVPTTLVVPPSGYVAPTVAMSGQMPMLGVNSTVSNVA